MIRLLSFVPLVAALVLFLPALWGSDLLTAVGVLLILFFVLLPLE